MSFIAKLLATSGDVSAEDNWIFRVLTPTNAGVNVSESNALTLPVVYSAVGIIADSVAQLPIAVMQSIGDRRVERSNHPISRLLNSKPNPYVTAFTLRNTAQSHVLLWGNGYMEIQTDNADRPIGLWNLLPDRTTRDGRDRFSEYRTTVDGKQFSLRADRVLHIPALGFDGLLGYSPVWMARQAIGLGLALEEFGAKFFANDAKSGGFLKHPGKLSEEAKKNIADSMTRRGGIDNAHRIKILEEGMEFQNTTIPPEDAQFLLSRGFQVEEIARLYRIPLFMLQNQSKDTAWGSGIAQMMLGFLTFTLSPWLLRWEQELTSKLFTPEEIKAGFYIKHNVNALLRGDAATRSDFYTKALNGASGWMTRNEVRALEDMNPDDQQAVNTSSPDMFAVHAA